MMKPTRDLLNRRSGRMVQGRPLRAVHWANTPELYIRQALSQVQAWLDAVVCSWRGLAGTVAVTVAVSRAV